MVGAAISIQLQQLSSASTATRRWSIPHSCSFSTGILSPHQIFCHSPRTNTNRNCSSFIVCKAVAGKVVEEGASTKQKSAFQVENLTSWLLEQQRVGNIDAELTIVISSISLACKQIASLLQRAGISKCMGSQGTINVQGEDQAKLDVIANEWTGIIASEEEEVPIVVEETYSGHYTVVFDPIDGSSNIDTSLTTGSIFGIYDSSDNLCLAEPELEETDCNSVAVEDPSTSMLDDRKQQCIVSVCQPGSNLLAAGYCMYSSSVVFVLSLGKGVFLFTLDPMYGEFVLTQKNIQIPQSGNIYSFNESNYLLWEDKLKKYIDDLKVDPSPAEAPASGGKRYKARYIGCLVGEIHRTLLYGGIYGNPSNSKSKKGNLRLLYECAPMNYLIEQAGGKGSDGHRRILDIDPEEIISIE
ncbi:hypothetical protein IFM89_008484 [Coptis chinensis]|uniref:fructose-bisphosphatase n=1 Tax=Coptis chinensis TaxID=261450 RepID=A0A835LHE0_9MAGN|nr:hypothetical protein IFM89_008484 [Coptis chinensis]